MFLLRGQEQTPRDEGASVQWAERLGHGVRGGFRAPSRAGSDPCSLGSWTKNPPSFPDSTPGSFISQSR